MKERESSLFFYASIASILGAISLLGFSGRVRDIIVGRAGNRSELSGVEPPEGQSLDIMHLDHTKDDTYDTPERGLAVTRMEHLIYHRVHKGRAHEIGLSEEDNNAAIKLLAWRVK